MRPGWRRRRRGRKHAILMRVVEEEGLMVCVFHGIALLCFVVLRGKARGDRHNGRISHRRRGLGGAIHAVWEVGLMLLILLVLLVLLLV